MRTNTQYLSKEAEKGCPEGKVQGRSEKSSGSVSLEVSTRYEEFTTEYSAEHVIATGNEL